MPLTGEYLTPPLERGTWLNDLTLVTAIPELRAKVLQRGVGRTRASEAPNDPDEAQLR